jgi:hypothetical protein
MKQGFVRAALAALTLGVALASPVHAQGKSIAVMPTLYFSADPASADNVTNGLVQQFEGQGYSVTPMDKSKSAFQAAGLQPSRHYADSEAIKFGRSVGSQLVAYPRLLAVGVPYAGEGAFAQPNAVILLRVVNVRTGRAIYARQIGHEFRADPPAPGETFTLPQPVATATAEAVLQQYFQRIKGSRLEN